MDKIAKGMGTSSGKAKGPVKIIKDFDDRLKFNEGDILVTRITDPTMTSMMGKAAGIICDIGGLTSHPSVLSREMGIPCIVSAKSIEGGRPITEFIKDGQVIEMDGETGDIMG